MKKTNSLEKRINKLEQSIDVMVEQINALKKSMRSIEPINLLKLLVDKEIDQRESAEYQGKGFWLSDQYNWELVTDSENYQVLIPTRK